MKKRGGVMVQRHLIVLPREDGGIEIYPLKEWLRQHPDVLSGVNPNEVTSHYLRNALLRLGWTKQESAGEFRLIQPGAASQVQNIGDALGENGALVAPEEGEADQIFTLEYQLRDFLAANLHTLSITEKKLKLFVDPTGRDGVEFPTAVGLIDILAIDENGDFYVFELKRANSSDRAVGQLTRYMGWVTQTIGKGRRVSGIIVAKGIGSNLRYSASMVPGVSLFEYEVNFQLQEAHELP
ncbi:MAG: DUF91 domain-containing protein [Alphaproteobacteria bacterium]|nr:DUF91 domain-containing protein [Alphaproteobacteria bacterium]